MDLREGLGRDPKTIRNIQSGTPGRVFENLIILGSAHRRRLRRSAPATCAPTMSSPANSSGRSTPFRIPASSATTPGRRTPGSTTGGVNTWGEISVDEKRGIAYFPLGSPTYDLYGADRIGANLFGDCLLALDARTGKRLWHFQLVHHDLWDYDPTTAPKLLTVKHDGKNVDIVAQATKFGLLYVFNRVTGEPLWPIEERPVPKTDMPGEQSWPTQPFPTEPPPFARQISPRRTSIRIVDAAEQRAPCAVHAQRAQRRALHAAGLTKTSIELPANSAEPTGAARRATRTTGMLYVRAVDLPSTTKLSERRGVTAAANATPVQRGFAAFSSNCGAATETRVPKVTADRFARVVRGRPGPDAGVLRRHAQRRESGCIVAFIANPAAGAFRRRANNDPPPPKGRPATTARSDRSGTRAMVCPRSVRRGPNSSPTT